MASLSSTSRASDSAKDAAALVGQLVQVRAEGAATGSQDAAVDAAIGTDSSHWRKNVRATLGQTVAQSGRQQAAVTAGYVADTLRGSTNIPQPTVVAILRADLERAEREVTDAAAGASRYQLPRDFARVKMKNEMTSESIAPSQTVATARLITRPSTVALTYPATTSVPYPGPTSDPIVGANGGLIPNGNGGSDVAGPDLNGFETLFPGGFAAGVVEPATCNGLSYMRIAPGHAAAVAQTLSQAMATPDFCSVVQCPPGKDGKISSVFCMADAEAIAANEAQPVGPLLAKLRAEGRACVLIAAEPFGTCLAGVPPTGLPDIAGKGFHAVVLSEPTGGWQPPCGGAPVPKPPAPPTPTATAGMSTGTKLLLGGLGLGLVGTVVYLATRDMKKKSPSLTSNRRRRRS